MNVGEWVGLALACLALLEALRRLLRRPVRGIHDFFGDLRNAVYDIRGYETRNPRTGETKRTPGLAEQVADVRRELQPNGGGSLRDVANEIHGVALENKATSARIERKADDAVIGAGRAAMVASTTAQGLEELREETRQRHAENLRRFADLENNDKDHEILRELLLMQLKDKHGIDLLGDEDDPDDPPPLHVA